MARPARHGDIFKNATAQKNKYKNTGNEVTKRMEVASRSTRATSFPRRWRCVCGHGVTPQPALRLLVLRGGGGGEVAAAVKYSSQYPRRVAYWG